MREQKKKLGSVWIVFSTLSIGCASQQASKHSEMGKSAAEERQMARQGAAGAMAAAKPSIVATAMSAGKFKTLVAALNAADLVSTLEGDGPFTVFAPTDEAFARLPAGTVEDLLKPENKAKLAAILKFHVVPGSVSAEKVVSMESAPTANGQQLAIAVDGQQVRVNGANVVQTDIECRNGIIHVIDAVVMPN